MFRRFMAFEKRFVVNFNKEQGSGDPGKEGAGGNDGGGAGKGDDLQSMKSELEALRKEKLEWSAKKDQDLSLNDKVKREREDQDKKQSEAKTLEAALTFNLTSADFLKQNESILPKGAQDIFKAADKEKYDSPIQKANAIKIGLIDLHFSQQSNVDFLTEDQKDALADWQKLTKNGKEEKSNEIYKNVFKPALDTMKRVKKAEELGRARSGYKSGSEGDAQYKERLMAGSRAHFLGEKK